LLGAYDWVSLLTKHEQVYERGVFDISDNVLRPSLTADIIRSLCNQGSCEHPLFEQKGWWHYNRRTI